MKRVVLTTIAATALTLGAVQAASASSGVQHLHFRAGPYSLIPGANAILLQYSKVPKPSRSGYIVRMAPNLHYALRSGKCCGPIPRVDVIHLHHGVWLSDGAAGLGEGNAYLGVYPFMASGEEKTIYSFPAGYGYPVGASDHWFLNYMLHNLTNQPAKVYITYDIDFIPRSSPAAKSITPVHPIWMDVRDHNIYPVFDVMQHSGVNGRFTYPDMAHNPYGGRAPLNRFTVDHPGTLISTAGHVHPGGLYDDLDLIRAGATPGPATVKGSVPHSVRLFRSLADYFGKRPPISWDMAMTATNADWRPNVNAGDVLRVSATYDTARASWYESMGIMVVWEEWAAQRGVDPFAHAIDQAGRITHGHLAENRHYGGSQSLGVNLRKFPSCATRKVIISGFVYDPGDFTAAGANRCIPTIKRGQSLTFHNQDALAGGTFSLFNPNKSYLYSIFHTITTCQNPCGLDTGISYPLANGAAALDSGQLGAGLPAVGRLDWSTPGNLSPGTYTFFCRIHPFMRGLFRVIR